MQDVSHNASILLGGMFTKKEGKEGSDEGVTAQQLISQEEVTGLLHHQKQDKDQLLVWALFPNTFLDSLSWFSTFSNSALVTFLTVVISLLR